MSLGITAAVLVMEPPSTSELEPPARVRRNDAFPNTLARAPYTQALGDGACSV